MNSNSSEFKLKVGKRGEIYTTAKLRRILNLKPGSTVIAKVVGEGKVLIEVTPTIEDLLERPKKVKLSVEEIEKLSVEAQKEVGIIE
jgi:bifunctional DNA-binding transcriptional regulator/antitoxin component of YhaV-PrlF toxin-antitoxin module